jgi:hypothetical protein
MGHPVVALAVIKHPLAPLLHSVGYTSLSSVPF